jgi:hypothetical protein
MNPLRFVSQYNSVSSDGLIVVLLAFPVVVEEAFDGDVVGDAAVVGTGELIWAGDAPSSELATLSGWGATTPTIETSRAIIAKLTMRTPVLLSGAVNIGNLEKRGS